MSVTIQVDSTGFQGMLRTLQKISGRTYEHILKDQTKKVLETCVRFTPSAKLQKAIATAKRKVDRRYNTYANGEAGKDAKELTPRISITKGGKWWVDISADRKTRPDGNRNGKRTYYRMNGGRKWSNERWSAYQREENDRVQDRELAMKDAEKNVRASRGLCKASWLEIADDLHIKLKVPAYVRKARPSNGKQYNNGSGTRGSVADAVFFDIINRMPTLIQKLNGKSILQRAISTRIKAFETELKKGVFMDLKTRCERYPGIFVHE